MLQRRLPCGDSVAQTYPSVTMFSMLVLRILTEAVLDAFKTFGNAVA
jgi:hypothetical protein